MLAGLGLVGFVCLLCGLVSWRFMFAELICVGIVVWFYALNAVGWCGLMWVAVWFGGLRVYCDFVCTVSLGLGFTGCDFGCLLACVDICLLCLV